jgi:hypothetical protein
MAPDRGLHSASTIVNLQEWTASIRGPPREAGGSVVLVALLTGLDVLFVRTAAALFASVHVLLMCSALRRSLLARL